MFEGVTAVPPLAYWGERSTPAINDTAQVTQSFPSIPLGPLSNM
jgi:hypothetical protein